MSSLCYFLHQNGAEVVYTFAGEESASLIAEAECLLCCVFSVVLFCTFTLRETILTRLPELQIPSCHQQVSVSSRSLLACLQLVAGSDRLSLFTQYNFCLAALSEFSAASAGRRWLAQGALTLLQYYTTLQCNEKRNLHCICIVDV